jgi:hypothetical protein
LVAYRRNYKKDRGWLEAEARLDAARNLPAGKERIEALRIAGMQRWLASKRLFEEEEPSDSHAPVEAMIGQGASV